MAYNTFSQEELDSIRSNSPNNGKHNIIWELYDIYADTTLVAQELYYAQALRPTSLKYICRPAWKPKMLHLFTCGEYVFESVSLQEILLKGKYHSRPTRLTVYKYNEELNWFEIIITQKNGFNQKRKQKYTIRYLAHMVHHILEL